MLRKWNLSDPSVLGSISVDLRARDPQARVALFDIGQCIKTLGIEWNASSDYFHMLWLERIGWDDSVLEAILQEWLKWRKELPLLSEHHIP